jgi:hypothetical protein
VAIVADAASGRARRSSTTATPSRRRATRTTSAAGARLALVNHGYDRSAWGVPTLRWPYFAPAQDEIAAPVDRCAASSSSPAPSGGGIYAARSALLEAIRARGVAMQQPDAGDNTLDRTAEIAASADAVLGFGRPRSRAGCDTRVFSTPAPAGSSCTTTCRATSSHGCTTCPTSRANVLRRRGAGAAAHDVGGGADGAPPSAFSHVQEHHSSVARVRQVLAALGAA